ncbi:MAG: hypothetical protein C5B50_09425 [Verrucomicrobia bacterium]|nr:MAG: hypothetical protein C5B50_09425 [Verrucomicrobiota bacterium]
MLLFPTAAFAKRAAPHPVPPVIWHGIEYRAPLDHMGHVQAFDQASGRLLWDSTVYHVLIVPWCEEDVQWVFVSSMQIQDGKLLVRNEKGESFELDLKTGRVAGQIPWFALAIGALVAVVAFIVWIRKGQRIETPSA